MAALTTSRDTAVAHHRILGELAKTCMEARPTDFHRMLDDLAQKSAIQRVYSQNVDAMETRFPLLETVVPLPDHNWPLTIQLHGSLSYDTCNTCHAIFKMQPEKHIAADQQSLACPRCVARRHHRPLSGKIQRQCRTNGTRVPKVVLYDDAGTTNPDSQNQAAVINYDARCHLDTVVVAGTSGTLPAIQTLIKTLHKTPQGKTRRLIWINPGKLPPSPIKGLFESVLRVDCQLVARYVSGSIRSMGRDNVSS